MAEVERTERDETLPGDDASPERGITRPLAGRYRLEHALGSGGMGVVYRARDLEQGRDVAVKLIRASLVGDRAHERFSRESAALAAIIHPGVVRYLDHGSTTEGTTYLVMELVEGPDLAKRLRHEPMPLDDVLALAERLAAALEAAHAAGVVHRDLKPSNILLPGGVVADAKLLDFGVARLSGMAGLTGTGHVLGTPGYMSPEQARGAPDVDGRTDIYSLGCVLSECLTGEPPFPGAHAMAVLAKVMLEDTPRVSDRRKPDSTIATGLDVLVHSMMARDPTQRPSSPTQLLARIARVRRGETQPNASDTTALSLVERRVLTVLFAGWATPTDKTAAATMTPLPGAARRMGGESGAEVIELVDGSVLVSFPRGGTPTDQAEQAARFALQIRARGQDVPIILASGHGVVSSESVLGDVIDRAAGLMDYAGSGEIRLDEPTAVLLEPIALVDYDDQGARLEGLRSTVEPLRTLLGRPTPFVGRSSELALLETVIRESLSEPCANAILVVGEPGIGKSRLRYELLRRERARTPELEVMLGRADPVGADAAYGLLARALRSAAGVRSGATGDEQLAQLDSYLFAKSTLSVAQRERVKLFLAELIGIVHARTSVALESARADSKLMREAITEAWETWLRDQCSQRGVVLVLEDLHWGDRSTVELVARSLEALEELPFVVLALARPEVDQRFETLWSNSQLRRVRLEPLSRRDARKLAARVLTDTEPSRLDAMVERSGGNAFYLEELLRAAAEGDLLPDTIAGTIQSRLEQLDPSTRRVLRAAAVFGEVCWSIGVARLVGETEASATTHLDQLAGSEFLTRRSRSSLPESCEYAFRHALVRDAVYATLTVDDRRIAHALAGEWLEAVGLAEPVVLAHHHRLGEQHAAALRWFERAAVAALDAEDHQRAINLVESAIACGAQSENLGRLHAIWARIAEQTGEHATAIRHGQLALELLREGSHPWLACVEVVMESLGRISSFEGVRPWLDRTLAQPLDAENLSALLSAGATGTIHVCKAGHVREASDYAARLRELAATAVVNPLTRLRLLELETELLDMAGDLAGMLQQLDLLDEVVESIDSPGLRAKQSSARGHLLSQFGANVRATAAFEVERAYASRHGLRHRLFGTLGMLAILAHRRGDPLAATRILSEARAIQTPDQRFIGVLCGLASMLALARGDADEALDEARRAEASLSVAPPLHPYGLAIVASALRARGAIDEALVVAERAIDILNGLGSISEIEVDVQVAHVEALVAAGRHEQVRDALRHYKARFDLRLASIPITELRESFCHGVPANARLLALHREWVATAGK